MSANATTRKILDANSSRGSIYCKNKITLIKRGQFGYYDSCYKGNDLAFTHCRFGKIWINLERFEKMDMIRKLTLRPLCTPCIQSR